MPLRSWISDREHHIFEARRLIDPPVTFDELAIEFRISRERVRQIETRAFQKVQMAAHIACARRRDSLNNSPIQNAIRSQSYAHAAPWHSCQRSSNRFSHSRSIGQLHPLPGDPRSSGADRWRWQRLELASRGQRLGNLHHLRRLRWLGLQQLERH